MTIKSNENVRGSFMNKFTSNKTLQNTNKNYTDLNERIYSEATKQRIRNFWYDR